MSETKYKFDKTCECCGAPCGERYKLTDHLDQLILDEATQQPLYLCCECAA